ncbi:MAG: Glucose-6-phosphate 1-dehydrogenase [Candidatus Dependentiae bacterium ADurb.Bin331]|nr:MAG: Glucose-6-phosphate 1-dehydrogenase [Candidatus Dependentiae bacterium ADurb.Bin331]
MNECTFIILGATGDLTKRKLIPALYKLVRDKRIEKFIIVGAAFEDVTSQEFLSRAKPFISSLDEKLWSKIEQATTYQRIDFRNEKDFELLHEHVVKREQEKKINGNRLAYLATASAFFCDISDSLGKSGLIQRADADGFCGKVWQRIVYEKPFGLDQKSAHQINACITKWFNENQIFRIDHYLTKELVSSIVLVRFTNIIFEPLWNHNYIDYVEIILSETLGLEGRGRYYDQYGVLRDVVQNHAMQLLSLIAMELPERLSAAGIQDQKAAVLKKIKIEDGFLGQYADYHQETDVNPQSQTPTFACLKFSIDTPRWANIPFYIKAGKRLDRKDTSVHIKFKNVDCTLKESCVYESDHLTIQIEPEAIFSLQLNTKQPGSLYEVTPVSLAFNHNYVFRTATPEAYEVLIEQIMLGDQSVSVRFDEIEYAWAVIDSIEKLHLPFYRYQQMSSGPDELKAFAQKYKMRWRV